MVSFLSPDDYVRDHVTGLTLEDADKYIYLFMATIVKRLEEKYSFNREINDKRIQKERLILPVNESGHPHWQYMSQYMQKIEAANISKVLEYMYISDRTRTKDGDFAG